MLHFFGTSPHGPSVAGRTGVLCVLHAPRPTCDELEKQKEYIEKDVDRLVAKLEVEGFSLFSVIGIVIVSIIALSGVAFLCFIFNFFVSSP